MTIDELVSVAVRRSMSESDVLSCSAANGVERLELFNRFAIRVAGQFLDGQMTFTDADWAVNRLNALMVADFAAAADRSYEFPEPAYSIYLAFDAGEFDRGDGVDPIARFTKPELRRILRMPN